MKDFLGWTVMASLALAGCGANVVVDGPSGTGGAPTTTTSSTITGTTTTVSTTTVTVTTGTTTSSGTCAPSCNEALQSGIPPCNSNGLGFYDGLLSCACSTNGACPTSCTANFCLHKPVTSPCTQCLQDSCGGDWMNCFGN
jgi:hypothetical protein